MSAEQATESTPAKDANYRRHGARFRARRRAVDMLFEAEARDMDPVAIIDDRVRLSRNPDNGVAPVADYTRTLVEGVAVELDRLDAIITRYLADDWELFRIPAVDRAILRMSIWEVLFNTDVPRKTAVVEGVELAANYSNDGAPAYINSVLDRVLNNAEELLATSFDEPEDTPDTELPADLLVGDPAAVTDASDADDVADYVQGTEDAQGIEDAQGSNNSEIDDAQGSNVAADPTAASATEESQTQQGQTVESHGEADSDRGAVASATTEAENMGS